MARPGVKVIAAGDNVPITKYATQLVDNLAKGAGYPADFAAAYEANIVSKEDNVKAVVAKIELGEGDAAIVYVTDAKASTKVATDRRPRRCQCPGDLRRRRRQGVEDPAAAKAFLTGSPGRTARPSSAASGSCRRRDRGRGRGAGVDRPLGGRPRSGRVGWGERSLAAVAALFALFLGLPVLSLVVRAVLDGRSRTRSRRLRSWTRSG